MKTVFLKCSYTSLRKGYHSAFTCGML